MPHRRLFVVHDLTWFSAYSVRLRARLRAFLSWRPNPVAITNAMNREQSVPDRPVKPLTTPLTHYGLNHSSLNQRRPWLNPCVHDTSDADSVWHGGTCPHFYKWLGTGAPRVRRTKQLESDQTVLTVTKALTKTTTNCICRVEKSGGARQKTVWLSTCAPTFKFVPAHNTTSFSIYSILFN